MHDELMAKVIAIACHGPERLKTLRPGGRLQAS